MMWLASCLRLTISQCYYLTRFNEIETGDGIEICRIPTSPTSARLILYYEYKHADIYFNFKGPE